MALVNIPGSMAEYILGNISRGRRMDTDYIRVKMVPSLLVTGNKVKQVGLEPFVRGMTLIIFN